MVGGGGGGRRGGGGEIKIKFCEWTFIFIVILENNMVGSPENQKIKTNLA